MDSDSATAVAGRKNGVLRYQTGFGNEFATDAPTAVPGCAASVRRRPGKQSNPAQP